MFCTRFTFDYVNPTISSYPVLANILEIRDANTGASLVSVGMPWSTATELEYGGVQLTQSGPTLVSGYSSTYTTFTVEVQANAVTITTSGTSGWSDTITVATNVNTTNNAYYLYLSKPSANSNMACAGGSIQNIQFTGTTIMLKFIFVHFADHF